MEQEVKPIFIIRMPFGTMIEELERLNENATKNRIIEDYHVLCFIDKEITTAKFECFYAKDFKETDFEELKKIVKES